MIRFVIPFIVCILFFTEPIFSLFSPIAFGEELLILVPRFLITFLIFIAVYYEKKEAIMYGIIFGLLYDIFYIDIIGVYAFLYPLISFLAAATMKLIYKHIIIVMLLSFILIALLEIFSFGFASLTALTSIPFKQFLYTRLIPTMLANSIFIIMFGWFFNKVFVGKLLIHVDEKVRSS